MNHNERVGHTETTQVDDIAKCRERLNTHIQWICKMVQEEIFLLPDLDPHYTNQS
jgi:hypothetical protein